MFVNLSCLQGFIELLLERIFLSVILITSRLILGYGIAVVSGHVGLLDVAGLLLGLLLDILSFLLLV